MLDTVNLNLTNISVYILIKNQADGFSSVVIIGLANSLL